MENLLLPQVIVETPAYLRAVEDFWDEETQSEFKNFIGMNFLLGDFISNLNDHEKKILRSLVQQLKNSFRNKEVRPNG